ncbi:MAG: molecular chaperone HscC [Lachnospiraceae bacterium]|nr:molecular chaperone HscC [Lachnospiraceae bacterium]
MSRIIGIDLGTTNSLAAVWKDGKSVLIPNAFGEYLTPSVVSVGEDGIIYVGKTAKERLISHPKDTVGGFKRFMGTAKECRLGGRAYRPEELSAFVLKRLREDAERYLGEKVEEAVISVPAYFNDMARNATKRAGIIAGLKVERIINEPSAAALACQNLDKDEDSTLLVFDFGGGTLDVSLVECFDNVIEILAVSGDNQLGGRDFDELLADYFIRTLKLEEEAARPELKEIIRKSAEQCKWELTEHTAAEMTVNCHDINKKMEITRKGIVRICASLFDRLGKPVSRVLADAQTPIDQISQIVLVGGSCKMPVVQQYLEYLLKRKDIEIREPDHMVAYGCGVYAGIKERNEDVKDMLLTDICPFSLGVGVVNHQDGNRPLMSFVIERNSPLPVSREEMYVTARDYQTEMRFRIYQGESMYVKDNIVLGEIMFNVPPLPRGEVQCFVRFTYDINGVLEVEGRVPMTDEEKHIVIVHKELEMTEEEIAGRLKEFEKLKMNPEENEENRYVLEWGQRLFVQCSQEELRSDIVRRLQYFQHVMAHDAYHLPKVRKYTTVFLAYVEGILGCFAGFTEEMLKDGSWYQDEEGEKEIEDLFQEWDNDDEQD